MSSTPQFNGDQLAAARSERWHQSGDALLTLEAAREWVGELGLVLFAPRAHQLAAPAPSLVEATLGRAVSAPSAAETETARGLVARMVAEGTALPLNLLGSAGDVPDFVVSAQAFSYVFTLRGDKNWKQPPGTSGTGSVSPLGLKVYEALVAGNALTARELVSELGREVTESAIVRALGELWMQLRVIPLLQQDAAGAKDSGTMWELTTRRFTKQIKAGANAGQPTALSAAISLYLAQVYAATEEEIETFLSPLTARSKVRDVLHGLTAARQLENAVLEGKTLVYIPGALPEFPEAVVAEPVAGVGDIVAAAVGTLAGVVGAIAGAARIRKFDGPRTPRPPREDRGERPFRKTGGERGGPRKPFGERGRPAKPFGERKPYARTEADRGRRRARVLENESGGRFSVKVLAVSGQSLRAPGMKIGSRDRGVRRVSVLKENEPIARTTRAARVRRESSAEVRGRAGRIAGRARNVRFGRVRVRSEGFASRPSKPFRPRREGEGEAGLRHGRRSRTRRVEKVTAQGSARGQQSRFVHAAKASRSRFVLGGKVNAKDLHHVRRGPTRRAEKGIAQRSARGRQSHFVRGVKVKARDLHHAHRSRISRGEWGTAVSAQACVVRNHVHIVRGRKAKGLHRVHRSHTSRKRTEGDRGTAQKAAVSASGGRRSTTIDSGDRRARRQGGVWRQGERSAPRRSSAAETRNSAESGSLGSAGKAGAKGRFAGKPKPKFGAKGGKKAGPRTGGRLRAAT